MSAMTRTDCEVADVSRIRSIKPEFWVSEQIGECSTTARLLFIGMWNFCDDQGVHPSKYMTLKAQVFPFDSITIKEITALVAELVSVGLIQEYRVGADDFWIVTGWPKHQKIDKPSRKYPLPLAEGSPNPRGKLGEEYPPDVDVEGRGRDVESNGEIARATKAGLMIKAMREAGIAAVNPGDVRLLAMIEAGATEDEFRTAAAEASKAGKNFGYALAIIKGRREDAAKLGSLPAAQSVNHGAYV